MMKKKNTFKPCLFIRPIYSEKPISEKEIQENYSKGRIIGAGRFGNSCMTQSTAKWAVMTQAEINEFIKRSTNSVESSPQKPEKEHDRFSDLEMVADNE